MKELLIIFVAKSVRSILIRIHQNISKHLIYLKGLPILYVMQRLKKEENLLSVFTGITRITFALTIAGQSLWHIRIIMVEKNSLNVRYALP